MVSKMCTFDQLSQLSSRIFAAVILKVTDGSKIFLISDLAP